MFDTKKFGAYVARQRKNADMTQTELAEKINLTRQAISKYEIGDSFPDISIVIQLAEVFNLTLDELINSGNPTKGESKILKNAVDMGESVDIDDIINIAPLIKPSVLKEFADKLNVQNIDILQIANLVQYLNDDDILKMLKSAEYDGLNDEMMEKMIPFLNDTSKEIILKKIIEGESDWRLIKVILPYIQNMTRHLEAAFLDGALPREVIDMINEYSLNKNLEVQL